MSNPNDLKPPLLSVYDLKKDYHTHSERLSILSGANFVTHPGDMTFIIGRSGSGKSTFLHLLAGLDQPTAGKIIFEGENLTSMKERALAKMRNERMGFVFQFFHLLPELTLIENVMLPLRIAGKRDKAWVEEILRRAKLLSRKGHYPSQLSGGEQQRAAIARALVNRPSLVLCDEPTGNLDGETSESIMSLINDLNQEEGQSFLIVTHDESIAWRYERVLRLVDGILIPAKENEKNLEQI